MTGRTRPLVPVAMPPLTLPDSCAAARLRLSDPIPRLRRLVCVFAAFTLPVLGVAVAETVHRAIAPKTSQAAAPVIPSAGAAAPSGVVTPARAARTMRTAARATEIPAVQS